MANLILRFLPFSGFYVYLRSSSLAKLIANHILTFLPFSGFYIYLESSYPRSKGESVRFESPYVISSYKCVTFWYHMWGEHVGRLNVFAVRKTGSEELKWRLSGDQGDSWNEGSTGISKNFAYKVRKFIK